MNPFLSSADFAFCWRQEGLNPVVLYIGYKTITMDQTHLQYVMDQDFGSSGGPILDEDSRVCGIIIGHQEDDDGRESNVGLIVSSEIMNTCMTLIQHSDIDLRLIKLASPEE